MKDYPYRLFYKPKGAAAADFIPFHHDGKFRLFYLHDWRDPAKHGEGTPWYLIETDDFVRFEERGEVIARGAPDEPDLFIFTGSVIRALGRFHIFYTAHNHHMAEQMCIRDRSHIPQIRAPRASPAPSGKTPQSRKYTRLIFSFQNPVF